MAEEANSFESHWPKVAVMIDKIISSQNIERSEWQDLFNVVHKICSWDETGCQKLLLNIKSRYLVYILEVASTLGASQDDQTLLNNYTEHWLTFTTHRKTLSNAFQQLDLAMKNSRPEAVKVLLLTLWHRYIVKPLMDRFMVGFKNLFFAIRRSLEPNCVLFNRIRQSFECIDKCSIESLKEGITTHDMIDEYYISCLIEYLRTSLQMLNIEDPSRMIMALVDIYESEVQRAKYDLQFPDSIVARIAADSKKTILSICGDRLVKDAVFFLDKSDEIYLHIVLGFIGDSLRARVKKEFITYIMDGFYELLQRFGPDIGNNFENYSETLYQHYQRLENMMFVYVPGFPGTYDIFEEAFKLILKDTRIFKNKSKPYELLTAYVDALFRKSAISRKYCREELDKRLYCVALIAFHFDDREAHMEFHKMHLKKRLLLNSCLDRTHEEAYFKDMYLEPEYEEYHATWHILRMYRDIDHSEDMQLKYYKAQKNEASNLESSTRNDNNNLVPTDKGDKIDFKILHSRAWRRGNDSNQAPDNIMLPFEIVAAQMNFEAFYNKEYPDRVLRWCSQLSHGTITFYGNKGTYDLSLTANQLSVISTFSGDANETKTLDQLMATTRMRVTELKATLWSLLANNKLQVQLMNCEPVPNLAVEVLKSENRFSINYDFSIIKNGRSLARGTVGLITKLKI